MAELWAWSGEWVVEDLKGAGMLEPVSKSDSVARHRLSSLLLVQVVVWLSEGSSVMSRGEEEAL